MGTEMKMPEGLSKAEKFFWEHAGYSYRTDQTPEAGRKECAEALAKAEEFARESGYSFHWEHDDSNSGEFSDEEPYYPLWCCVAHDGEGKVVASLGGVDFGRNVEPWGQSYRRVVEAELASESMPD